MTARHDVTLSYKDGKRTLLIDGEPVKGVTSTTIELPAAGLPVVTIKLHAATFNYESDGPVTLSSDAGSAQPD